MIALFALAEMEVSRAQVSDWLKKDEDPSFRRLTDFQFATFLNGFIVKHRGKKEGPTPKAEQEINNNIIFRKLKIALNLKVEEILDIFMLVKAHVSKPEVTALFRRPDQRQYRECQDQFLRYFLQGLQVKYGKKEEEK
ncbi:MAG: hypothetical protein ACI956_002595 [Nonlabens sp.]|jgi:uncharacterized protein YehS (DUF1456 family)